MNRSTISLLITFFVITFTVFETIPLIDVNTSSHSGSGKVMADNSISSPAFTGKEMGDSDPSTALTEKARDDSDPSTALSENTREDSDPSTALSENTGDDSDPSTALSNSDRIMKEGFVIARNGSFYLDGSPFRFAGTNAYYLPNYEKLDPGVVDRAFDAFEDAGITVVRMWAFYDGYDCGYSRQDSSENVIQTKPGSYSESALRDLDRVIAKGKERGIRFILPFINYWNELGGICQYNTWAAAKNPERNMMFFLNHPDTQQWFKDYISMLLNRVNTATGIAYKDEPAIFAWQIMNEGRNPGEDPMILRNWYAGMARYIKSIAPNHMVSTGEEGFDEGTPTAYSVKEYSNTYALRAGEGTSYIRNISIPEIDFGAAHWYPPEFGFGHEVNENMLRAQRAWIHDHAKIAQEEGKPFVLGEYGFPAWGDERMIAIYGDLWELAESIELNGSLLWQLTADGTKCFEFGGNICFPGGREDRELFDSFRRHVSQVAR